MKSRWRAITFFVLALGAFIAGGVLRGLSVPPRVPASEGIKQLIGIYVSDPSAKISATVEVANVVVDKRTHKTRKQALLDVSGDATRVIVTSTVKDTHGEFHRVSLKRQSGLLYAHSYQLSHLPHEIPGRFTSIAEFDMPEGAISNVDGTYVARLPALAFNELGQQVLPAFSATNAGSTSMRLYDVAEPKDYRTFGSKNPGDYGLPDVRNQELYWEPANLSTRVILMDGANFVDDARIDAETPSSGNLIGPSIMWTSNAGIAPFLSATKWGAIDSRSRWEFYSGILLGIGAAAVFALFVELPDESPIKTLFARRRARRADRAAAEES